jgi:hypothetical protein
LAPHQGKRHVGRDIYRLRKLAKSLLPPYQR